MDWTKSNESTKQNQDIAGIPCTSLMWGFKRSFVNYIEGMSDGQVHLTDGASRHGAGFVFPFGYRQGSSLMFQGSVQFTGHFGMLNLNVEGLRLSQAGDRVSILIADEEVDGGQLMLASGTLNPASAVIESVRLSREGADLFFENYKPGEPLEDIQLCN
ncbi:HtaA domain-containing protein [Paenarthrobacter nitroguajacolicus]|uniref:HtaA domain-containing protein n=1 Tax=Paenarthrobacter nitroguajacolicus TaxID=211146 RepID=UPI000B1A5642|nr:HtaA domain-containing protein [Paenarthrobacter nitroguajacolicus]